MVDIVTRAEWGARSPKSGYTSLSSTKGVKVHYTGGHVDPKILDDHKKCVALVKSIQNMHMDGNGWIDIGYSVVACPHRKVFIGRGPKHLPAANGAGLNTGHYAILALVGNSGLTVPSDNQLLAIWDAITYLRDKGNAGKEIKGHRDGYSTECPGDKLYAWLKKGAPRPGGGDTPTPAPPKPHTPADPAALVVDGILGRKTISRWQQIVGTTVDGDISTPSTLVRKVQQILNAHGAKLKVDGLGIRQDDRHYETVEALQRYLDSPVDGRMSKPVSLVVKALQKRLNTGRF
ncbi:peptidoglycan recognition protein family protein [Planotetraspora phitsanulokensis]|uniref:Peptidoglycan recognition protein family domain-containing protein n=2 Tax=Planotetraspora phitsanulokensis TaxID=575192 RepID=A0A8J3UDL9_9ACTN|nr:peptidoglycan recognition family protein [Planotetraspora phitsanulokensis]GII42917.1 hypothetical protein Pph01_79200 [Planotetraspora phitsanulokensis]